MTNMIDIGGLKVDLGLYRTVNEKIIPGTDVDPSSFGGHWKK